MKILASSYTESILLQPKRVKLYVHVYGEIWKVRLIGKFSLGDKAHELYTTN